MSNRTAAQRADLESLRTEYRDAFENWAAQTDRLHEGHESAAGQDGLNSDEQASADAAQTTYRSARDRLAAEMMNETDE